MFEKVHTAVTMILSVAPSATESTPTDRDGADSPDESLLTDEEQVLRLLQRRGDWMWQREIVVDTGFSESKTSRLLCEMESADLIRRRRAGRKKVVSLPADGR